MNSVFLGIVALFLSQGIFIRGDNAAVRLLSAAAAGIALYVSCQMLSN